MSIAHSRALPGELRNERYVTQGTGTNREREVARGRLSRALHGNNSHPRRYFLDEINDLSNT